MRITHHLAILAAVFAAGLSLTGCDSGASQPANSAFFGPGSAPNNGGGGPSGPPPFRAVALHSDLFASSTTGVMLGPMGPTGPGLVGAGIVVVYVNDFTVTNPTLVIDSGGTGTFVASGAAPTGQPNWLGFLTGLLPVGSAYKVIADQNGLRVESNSVIVAAINRGTVTITEPFGDFTGLSMPIAAPLRANWNAIGGGGVSTPDSYMIMLGLPQPGIMGTPTDLEFLATIPGVFTTYTWGDATADHYAVLGPDPLPVGRHQLTIFALDNTGWGTDSSDANTNPIVPYTFEVQ